MLSSELLALCSLTHSEINGLYDELGIASDLDAQKVVHRILYMLGEGLDRDKLNALLHDGTLALKLQENFHIFAAPVVLARWTQLGFDFSEPITPDVAVNNSIFCGCTMQVVLKLLEWIAGQPLAPRVDGVPVSLAHGSSPDWFIHATASLSHTPPASPKCVLTPLQSTPLHCICILSFFVHLHPSVARNRKTSLIFRKRSEPEPTPSPDPAASQAARDLGSRRYSHSRRVQARRNIDQTRSPPPSPAAHAVLSVQATTRMCRSWCPHPKTTPILSIHASHRTAYKPA